MKDLTINHDALQYLMLGAGEGRMLMRGAKPVDAFNGRKDFDVFARQPTQRKRKSLWARL